MRRKHRIKKWVSLVTLLLAWFHSVAGAMVFVLAAGLGPDVQAGQVTVWLDDGSQVPGSTNTEQPFSNGDRDVSWDISATVQNGLADVGVAVMTVRMLPISYPKTYGGTSREATTGFGYGLSVYEPDRVAPQDKWLQPGDGAVFHFTFYEDESKTKEIHGLSVTFNSLVARMAASLGMDVFAGAGDLVLTGNTDADDVMLDGSAMTIANDSVLSFVSESGLVPDSFSGTDFYTVNGSGDVIFSENETFWVRRSDDGVAAYQLAGLVFNIRRAGLVSIWLDDGTQIPESTNTEQPFSAGDRDVSWDIPASVENGLIDIGAKVMTVRMLPFSYPKAYGGTSREATTGFGYGLSVYEPDRVAPRDKWLQPGDGAVFQFTFYEDESKTTEIHDVNITFNSLIARTASAAADMNVYAGSGNVMLTGNSDADNVTMAGSSMTIANDSVLSFVSETGLVATDFTATGIYRINGTGAVSFSEEDALWVRRNNEYVAYQLAGIALKVEFPISVDDFGAVGNGEHDDTDAVIDAIEALRERGPGGKLEFSAGKTYKLGLRPDSTYQIDLQNMTNVTVDGNGAMLLNTPWRASIQMMHCQGVAVKNLEIEQDPLSYTQAEVTDVSVSGGWFEMEIMDGYDLIPDGTESLDWGAMIDPDTRMIRPGMMDHFRTASYTSLGGGVYRLYVQSNYVTGLNDVQIGDIYFQPFIYNGYASNIHIANSSDCLLENVTLYSGRSGMSSLLEYNTGLITIREFNVKVRSGTDRVVSNWRDGVHCANNRVGPVIENCYFERMLDDSINMSQYTIMAAEVISSTTFRMSPTGWTADTAQIWAGDDIMVFYPPTGEYIGPVTVTSVDPAHPEIVTFSEPVLNVITGTKQPEDVSSTHFYNMDMCNAGYIVRNNTFDPQRRHAVLARGINGTIEGNLIENVGGNGIVLENAYGTFYEGPFPRNVIISNNIIFETYDSPIRLYARSGYVTVPHIEDITIADNIITVSNTPAVELNNVQDVIVLQDNRFYEENGSVMSDPLQITDSINISYPHLLDGGFEAEFPDVDETGFDYQPVGTPWEFSLTAGYSENDSAFTLLNPPAPEGFQVLLVQQGGSASQMINFDSGTYTLSFYAAQRKTGPYQVQQLQVLVDNVSKGTFQPSASGSYEYFQTTFTLSEGMHVLKLQGLVTSLDTTVLMDQLQIIKQ